MNTENIHEAVWSSISASASNTTAATPWKSETLPSATGTEAEVDSAIATLARLTSAAGFSTVAPRLESLLGHMAAGENVLETLTENVAQLQDGFVDTLYCTLAEQGVDISQKMSLRLDDFGLLQMVAEHPQKEMIDAVLINYPELSMAFMEIAAQSAALRDIRSLQFTIVNATGAQMHSSVEGEGYYPSYQISIKGDMNHFYFSK